MVKTGGDGKGTAAVRVGRFTLAALLLWLLILDIVLIGVAADVFNRMINGALTQTNTTGPNPITPTVLLFALIDGGFLGAGVLLGFSHVYLYNAGSVGPAFTSAVFAWGINILTLGFVCKEINLGKQYREQKVIEWFVIIIGFFSTIYVMILFGALHHPRGPGVGYHSSPV